MLLLRSRQQRSDCSRGWMLYYMLSVHCLRCLCPWPPLLVPYSQYLHPMGQLRCTMADQTPEHCRLHLQHGPSEKQIDYSCDIIQKRKDLEVNLYGNPPGCYVGWLVHLRINVDLAIFQPYLDLEAGDNQSLKIQVARPGIEPRVL